jgi:hypothetical protein
MSEQGGQRRRKVRTAAGVPLGTAERRQLLDGGDLVAAWDRAILAAVWLSAADAVLIRLGHDVALALEPTVPDPVPGLFAGGPLAGEAPRQPPLADRIRLWTLLLDIAGDMGLTARGRVGLGLELTPPDPGADDPGAAPAARARGGGPRTAGRADG